MMTSVPTTRYDTTTRSFLGKRLLPNFLNQKCGIKDWQNFSNHNWHHWMITQLANNPEVSAKEQLEFSCHSSMTSARLYMHSTAKSSAKLQHALQLMKMPSVRSLTCRKKAVKKTPAATKKSGALSSPIIRISTRIASQEKNQKKK